MQRTIPSDESAEDTAFVNEQSLIWVTRGVAFRFSHDFGPGQRYSDGTISAFAYLNGAMYCSAFAYTRRQALETCIATIVAGLLQGLVIEPPSLAIKSGAF